MCIMCVHMYGFIYRKGKEDMEEKSSHINYHPSMSGPYGAFFSFQK